MSIRVILLWPVQGEQWVSFEVETVFLDSQTLRIFVLLPYLLKTLFTGPP